MREVFFVLLVIAVILVLTAYRYRAQIASVYRFWKVLRDIRLQGTNANEINTADESTKGPLVNCAKCGIWIPESNAIKLGARIFYCSAECVEKTATAA